MPEPRKNNAMTEFKDLGRFKNKYIWFIMFKKRCFAYYYYSGLLTVDGTRIKRSPPTLDAICKPNYSGLKELLLGREGRRRRLARPGAATTPGSHGYIVSFTTKTSSRPEWTDRDERVPAGLWALLVAHANQMAAGQRKCGTRDCRVGWFNDDSKMEDNRWKMFIVTISK